LLHKLPALPTNLHWGFYDASLPPVLRIRSGDVVEVETATGDVHVLEAAGAKRDEIPENLRRIPKELKERGPGPHVLTGPIFIDGAKKGDVLEVLLRQIRPILPFGYNLFLPNLGTLPEDYPYERRRLIRFDLKRKLVKYSQGIKIPIRPFFGNLGVAPTESLGRQSSTFPGPHGGNLDIKELIAGTSLFLPVQASGGLFSIGDGHACQGDGEVDLTAAETCLQGTLKFRVRKEMKLKWPMAETRDKVITMGFHEDLDEAARLATRNMIEYLEEHRGMDRDDAYVLSSLAVDLHISQLVNTLKGVHAVLPKSIFEA